MAGEPHTAHERDLVVVLLRGGLVVAMALLAAGLLVRAASGASAAPGLALSALASADVPLSERLLGLGILALGLTPAVRVLALVGLWAQEKDWRFVGVALTVLVLLAVALVAGGA